MSRRRTIFLLLFMTFMAQPAQAQLAQNPVPPTARQAAASPDFAQRLAHPGPARPAAPPDHRASPQGGVLYENGPLNGTYDAFTINFGYVISNSLTLGYAPTVTGFDFYTWSSPGDKPLTVDWSITSAPFGGTVYGRGTGAALNNVIISTNGYDYQINHDMVTGLNVSLNTGTYYLNLQNAVTNEGQPLYWDENDGAGCKSPGCPSQADDSGIGTIGSETFDITGSNPCSYDRPVSRPSVQAQASSVTAPVAPDLTFSNIYYFTGGLGGYNPQSGVTVDQAGNLYGTTSGGGSSGLGLVYRLSHFGSLWLFSPLYSFQGSDDGSNPLFRVTKGPCGSLYGTAANQVLNLRPPVTACRTALCSWTKTLVHRLGDADRPAGELIFDQAGNLYGAIYNGVAYGRGAVYQLTPSPGGWTENLLYSFTGGSDGGNLYSGVVLDQSGNLYGAAWNGGYTDWGTIYQLTPSGSGWGRIPSTPLPAAPMAAIL